MNEARYRDIISGRATGAGAALVRLALSVMAIPFSLAARIRLKAYDIGILGSKRAPIPVICVGNLSAGGSGKTPMVVAIAKALRAKDLKLAVVSRGYRALDGDGGNDEARLVAEELPEVMQFANPDRHAAVIKAAQEGAEVVLLDDGFSHRRLERDMDILLFDATAPFGYGRLLPRGTLREPLSSAKRAHFGVLTRSDHLDEAEKAGIATRINALSIKELAFAEHRPTALHGVSAEGLSPPLDSLEGKKVIALCGIANPHAFQSTLESLGAEVLHLEALEDHFAYPNDWLKREWPRLEAMGADALVMTQKDAVKLRGRIDDSELMAFELRVEMTLEGDGMQRLMAQIERAIKRA